MNEAWPGGLKSCTEFWRACFATICKDCDRERRQLVIGRSRASIHSLNQRAAQPSVKIAWTHVHALSRPIEVNCRYCKDSGPCHCRLRGVHRSWSPDSQVSGRLHPRVSSVTVSVLFPGSYLVAVSLARKLDSPEGLRVATRDVFVHAVRDRISVTAALRCVQLERAGTVVDTVAGVNKGVDKVGRNANLGASSGPSRVGGELLIVEERRDGGVSVVALLACERVEVQDTAVAAV